MNSTRWIVIAGIFLLALCYQFLKDMLGSGIWLFGFILLFFLVLWYSVRALGRAQDESDDMQRFAAVRNYATAVEAEVHAAILRKAGVAALLQGPQAGIFGAGFSGASVQGVTLLVPEDQLEDALELIGDDEA